MNVNVFLAELRAIEVEFFAGVPDSLLKPLCDYLIENFGISSKHVITANEGNAVATAAGYHLATGKVPLVYLQNSGLGNVVNPVTSLITERVYAIPTVFVVGWRGEPGVHDEPQHEFQGELTLEILKSMDVSVFVVEKDISNIEFKQAVVNFKKELDKGKSVAFVVRKDALSYNSNNKFVNSFPLKREEIIEEILSFSEKDLVVATTGKTSREVFEIREKNNNSHKQDFLTVGSMGHCSSIAFGMAMSVPTKRVWCIDGDGSALMHLGSMATLGSSSTENIIHVLINNEAHESVGGQPTVANRINFKEIANGCGYNRTYSVENLDDLRSSLQEIKHEKGPIFIEIKSSIGSRKDLGRPTLTPTENKRLFMDYIKES